MQSKQRHHAQLLLAACAFLAALAVVEVTLRILDRPQFHPSHTETRRFLRTDIQTNGVPMYVNYPGLITFTYADNPRGYFNSNNEVHHEVNPDGFRGRSFGPKLDDTLRLVFLGDSFTFGEGVKLEDTYPEITARYLSSPVKRFESFNLGVGGYNTTQAEYMLDMVGLGLQPDAVILGYTLNDAEPPLFSIDPVNGRPVRRSREALIESEGAPQRPPESGIYRLRLAQLVWQAKRNSRLTRQTVNYYNSLYEPEKEGWRDSEQALGSIITKCHERNIPCIVVMFPVLHKLSDDYPFARIHKRVGNLVEAAGGTFVDLLPALKGMDERKLWVHPTDQHPNERVHAIAAEHVAEVLREKMNHE